MLPAISLSVVAGLNLMMGFFVLAQDRNSQQNRVFFSLSVSVAFWAAGLAAYYGVESQGVFKYAVLTYYVAAASIAPVLIALAYTFKKELSTQRLVGLLGSFTVLAAAVYVFPKGLFSKIELTATGERITDLNLFGYGLYSAYFLTTFIFALYLFYEMSRGRRSRRSLQSQYMIMALIIAGTVGIACNLILPAFDNFTLIWAGPATSVVFLMLVAIAIAKAKLFNVKEAISRAVAYLFSVLALVVIYTLLLGGLFEILDININLSLSTRIVILIMFALATSFYPYIKRLFDYLTRRIFYRNSYDPQEFLDTFSNTIARNLDLKTLVARSTEIIDDNFHPTRLGTILYPLAESTRKPVLGPSSRGLGTFSIEKAESQLETIDQTIIEQGSLPKGHSSFDKYMIKQGIKVIVRLKAGSETAGYLLLGEKRSGESYDKQDMRVLDIISDEFALAIQNAIRYEQIEKFTETLQQEIDQATSQLKKSNTKLKALDAAKDEFISMASHQLRTPLTSVKGYISMVLEGDAGKINTQQAKLLDQAFISSQRMVYLIADLLNVSRIRTGKFVIEAKPTYLPDVVEGEISQLYETAAARGLKILFDKPREFPTLMLDETKVRQVVMNFTDNAIYYTPNGGTITIELKATKSSILFAVHDTGIGVPKKEIPHLFTKFYRAGNARKARPDGTGLGLYMAKKVVVAQGGAMKFSTREGKGSTFGFTFPRAKLEVKDDSGS